MSITFPAGDAGADAVPDEQPGFGSPSSGAPGRLRRLAADLVAIGASASGGTAGGGFGGPGWLDETDEVDEMNGSGGLDQVTWPDGVGGFDGMDDDQLSAVLVRLVGVRERLSAVVAEAGEIWARRRIWAVDGSRSAGHRLARDTNTSVAAAKRLLAAGRAATEMPVVAAAWAEGRLSAEHVALFADARRGRDALFERDEQTLVEQAERLRFAETRKVVAYWKLHADAELDPDGVPPVCTPAATVATTYGGVVHLTAALDPVGGAVFAEALARIEHEVAVADRAAGRVRSIAERNAEALVEMAKRAHAAPVGARKPEPLLLILTGQESFSRLCELSTGQVIHPGHVVGHLTRCDIQTIVFDGADRAIAASPQRCFTGALRRAIQARDRACTHEAGCDEPISRCDVDHITEHTAGGVTDQDNGRLHCTTHNRDADLRNAGPPPEAGAANARDELPEASLDEPPDDEPDEPPADEPDESPDEEPFGA